MARNSTLWWMFNDGEPAVDLPPNEHSLLFSFDSSSTHARNLIGRTHCCWRSADFLESTAISRAFEEVACRNGSKGSWGDLVRRVAEGHAGDASTDESDADERELGIYEPVWNVLRASVWCGDDD